jgi:hypothetical protein
MVCVDCHYYGEAISAIRKSLVQIEPAKALFLSDIRAHNPNFPFEIVNIKKISSKGEYSQFIIKELDKYIETDFVLIIQHDGYVLDPSAWDDGFLEYDYIGAPWLESDGYNVGNGGFSLRSKKLQHILATDDFIQSNHSAEDVTICRLYRPYLEEKYGIKFAPEELADKFSFELREPCQPTFGFHSNFHKPFKQTVVVKRTGALGDIIATEPLLGYYHNKGFNVAIDMPVHLCMFFGTHFFPIKHISQLDGRVLEKATVIDLDGSYEKKPKQLHLKSYYEEAAITDGEIKNPKLKFPINESNKLFKKYVVLHIDQRDQKYRNIYGVNWGYVVSVLKENGYDVFQIGQTEHEEVPGAIQMTTQTTHLMLYLIAGSDGFIGVDSGPAAMAVASGIKSAIFFGSVDPKVIHPDLSNVQIIEHEKVCDTPKCWGDVVDGVTGKECVVDAGSPPCTRYTTQMVIDALNKML